LSNPPPKNLPASIRQKLLDLARARNDDFGLILVKYGLERILYRLSRSAHRDVFVLKGALLFELWTHKTYRPTRDADFLARGDNAPERFVHIFRTLCVMEVEPDGLTFDPDSVKAEHITEDADYEGVRVTFTAYLDRARIPIQIDIGFGDAITPGPVETEYPTLLPAPGPRLLAYPKETVVAEKFEAIVKLGIANTRMKDFYDLQVHSRTLAFDGKTLSEAIRKTFRTRGTELPTEGMPLAFTPEFYDDESKRRQWTAFCAKKCNLYGKDGIQKCHRHTEDFSSSRRRGPPRRRLVLATVETRRPLALNGVAQISWALISTRLRIWRHCDPRFNAGHANNALPQRAEANVNCRIVPGHSAEEGRQEMIKLLADPKITVRYVNDLDNISDSAPDRKSFPPPPLRRDVFAPLEKITAEMWPGTPVIPDMATGASDGIYTMSADLPTYGIAGIAIDRDDNRAHGRDERLGVDSFFKGVDFYYRYLKAVTSE